MQVSLRQPILDGRRKIVETRAYSSAMARLDLITLKVSQVKQKKDLSSPAPLILPIVASVLGRPLASNGSSGMPNWSHRGLRQKLTVKGSTVAGSRRFRSVEDFFGS